VAETESIPETGICGRGDLDPGVMRKIFDALMALNAPEYRPLPANMWRAQSAAQLFLLLLAILLSDGIPVSAQSVREVTLALTPSRGPTVLQEVGGELGAYLGRYLGVPVKVQVASDYAGVIEALRSQLVHVAFLTTVGYVLAAREAGAQIVVKATRGGRVDYAARIFVL
jgi:ABC-type phosphate/phosphonate transport system substrate-binding protein